MRPSLFEECGSFRSGGEHPFDVPIQRPHDADPGEHGRAAKLGKAKLPKRCSIHGLRKGCLHILAEAGCNILELRSRSGHLTLSELQKYVDAADKRFAADRAGPRN
jgi:hypothetical protein